MNWRWYIPVLLIALTFFGVSLEQSTLPNQEIVVQFTAQNVSDTEAKKAIASVTSQLKAIGITNVIVSEIANDKLKLTYYSAKDVATIKGFFSSQNNLQLADSDFNGKENSSSIPFSDNAHIYKLDVIKIQQDYEFNIGLQGLPVDVKFVKDHYLKPFLSVADSASKVDLKLGIERIAFKNYRNISLLIDNTSYKIPEVRAGPLS